MTELKILKYKIRFIQKQKDQIGFLGQMNSY